ncbi:MAG: glycerol-3-phosphate dehydrogenase C-terminal domain-containing protein, partial [Bacteroidota bacterium]
LEGANAMFPGINLTMEDVESSWAGVRPLIHEEGKSASEISRKDEIFVSETGLISIAGGKLTGYRKMSERIVDLVAKKYQQQYKQKFGPCTTDTIPLAGGHFRHYKDVEAYLEIVRGEIKTLGLDNYLADYLVANYGKQTDAILNYTKSFSGADALTNLTRAEFKFGVEQELVVAPIDYYARRSGRLFFDIQTIHATLDAILEDCRDYFNWEDATVAQERKVVQQAVHEASHFEHANATTSS